MYSTHACTNKNTICLKAQKTTKGDPGSLPPNLHSISTSWLTVSDCPAAALDIEGKLDFH